MKRTYAFVVAVTSSALIIIVFAGLGTRTTLSQTAKNVSSHTVIYLVQQYMNGTLKSQRIVSRSVNERGEW